jgi:hypothetical protein
MSQTTGKKALMVMKPSGNRQGIVGVAADMPFAEQTGCVPSVLQKLAYECLPAIHAPGLAPVWVVCLRPEADGVAAGVEGAAGR